MAYLEHTPVRTLYHYTSEEGLFGIAKSRELWLSDLRASNDPRDFHLGIETLKRLMTQVRHNEYDSDTGKAVSILFAQVAVYFDRCRCYTACFTPHGDDINMWREYGQNGRGFSIGFRPRAITDMHGRLYQVRYIDENSEHDIYNLLTEILKPIDFYGLDIFNDLEKSIEIPVALISVVNSIKHFTWSYEGEVRLTFASGDTPPPNEIPVSLFPDETEYPWKPSQKRYLNGREVRYHAFPFGRFKEGVHEHTEAISDIVIGPKAQYTEADIRRALTDCGFSNFQIRNSLCAFR